MESKREFSIKSEDGAKAHLVMSLSRYNNVQMNISVESSRFSCSDTLLHNRISRKVGRLYRSDSKDGHTTQLPFVIPESQRDEICDALEEMKELSKKLKGKDSAQ